MQPEVNTTRPPEEEEPDRENEEERGVGQNKAEHQAAAEPSEADKDPASPEDAEPAIAAAEPSEAPASPEDAGPAKAAAEPAMAEPAPPVVDKPVQARPQQERLSVSGDLRQGRGGAIRALLLVTGLALIAWIARGLLALLGYRHPATLSLGPRGLEVAGERRFMGLALGTTQRLVPLASIQLVDLVGRSSLWALAAAVLALVVAGAIGVTLVLWGFYGREASWIVAGLMVIGAGVVLDALAYLWTRLSGRRGLADLEVRSRAARMRLRRVDEQVARRLVQRLARGE